MTERIPVGIAGTGSYMPERVVTNFDLEKLVDTSDEWILQRTGISERRYAADGQGTSDMVVRACQSALEQSGIQATDVDLIVVGTVTPDYTLPSTAVLVQDRLGATGAAAFDVVAACTGFLAALHTAEAYIAAGRAKCALAIGAEKLSSFLDMTDRASCILFGDGAGVAILKPLAECGRGEILRTVMGADGSGFESIHTPHGGSLVPPHHPEYKRENHYIKLRGREVFRFAVSSMSRLVAEVLEGYDMEEFGLLVPHQVNRRIIDSALDKLGWTDEKVMINIQKYGNTSAATVPVALDEAFREGRLEEGKLVVLVAFGAGLTWAATLLRW